MQQRRRPSAPFGNPEWLNLDEDDLFAELDKRGRPMRPDLFRSIRRFRRARIRLVVEVTLFVASVVLFFFVPNFGESILVCVFGIACVYDTLLVLWLNRTIEDAWEDLTIAPEG